MYKNLIKNLFIVERSKYENKRIQLNNNTD